MLKRGVRFVVRMGELFPFTPLGLAVALASYTALQHYGYKQRDLFMFAVSALGLLLVALAVLTATVAAFVVFRSARSQSAATQLQLDCGRWSTTGFSVRSVWFVPFATVAWRWCGLRAEVRQERVRGRLNESVRATRRGMVSAVDRRFEVGDVFGLARFSFHARQVREVRLLPAVGALRQVAVIRGLSSGADVSDIDGKPEGDPFDTRRYAPGDPIRFILWKVFAKSRNLIVRTPERATSPVEHTVAYLVAGKGDEPAAAAARVAVDLGAFGNGWRIGADGMSSAPHSRAQALDLLSRSGALSEEFSGAGLARFVEDAGVLDRLVVFVPARPGPWLRKVAAAVRPLKGKVDFVVGTDGIARDSNWVRALSRTPQTQDGEPAVPIDEVLKVVKALSGGPGGPRVVVIDRLTGQAYLPEKLPRGSRARSAGAA